jgi:hypothetical protein
MFYLDKSRSSPLRISAKNTSRLNVSPQQVHLPLSFEYIESALMKQSVLERELERGK